MKRGDVYLARLDPTEGSEQAGARPVVIVSRDAINAASPVVVVVPLTTFRKDRRIYPSQTTIQAGDGGLEPDSVSLGEQARAIAKQRLGQRCGALSEAAVERLDHALLVTLDLQR